jgi:hypothetical protein
MEGPIDNGIELTEFLPARGQAAEHACQSCGTRTTDLGEVCRACLHERYHREIVALQAYFFHERPHLRIQVGRDRGRHLHLVFATNNRMGFCGKTVVENLETRRSIEYGRPFPLELCSICLRWLEAMKKGEVA